MILHEGNYWAWAKRLSPDILVVTTNGVVKNDGTLVMGAGIAKEFAAKFPALPAFLGEHVKEGGNHVGLYESVYEGKKVYVASLPTKDNWRKPSSLKLIQRSAVELLLFLKFYKPDGIVLSTRPGCGNGGLLWDNVYPVLKKAGWDDCFHIVAK